MRESVDLERMRKYVRIWQANGPFLDAVRDEDIRKADTTRSILMFEQAFRIALHDLPLRPDSGLVAWQDAMMRWRTGVSGRPPLTPIRG